MAIQNTIQTASMVARDEVRQQLNDLTLLHVNAATAAALGITTATTTSKVKFANTATYRFEGVNKTLAAQDNFWTLNGPVVAVSMFQKWLLGVDVNQAAVVIPGVPATTAAGVTFASVPQGVSLYGVCQVATDGTHTFTPATTLLGATGITATFWDGYDPSLLTLITLA